jgi:hypothetical protein
MPSKDPTKHKNAATWGKGQSGNPGGRSPRIGPNGETAAQLARMHTADAIETLAEVTNNKKAPAIARVAAANALLDRGWGKPKELVELDASVKNDGVPVIQIVRVPADAPSTAH